MTDLLILASIYGLAALATVLLVLVIVRSRRAERAHHDELDERLAETHDESRTHLDRPPRVRDVVTVDHTADGEAILVPIVRVDLGTTEAPGSDLVFEFVASVLEAIHPVLEDATVSHYDVQFTFGPDGLFVSGVCQRVSVPPALVERLVTDERYRASDLRRDVERGDDGDDATAPVSWGECTSYRGTSASNTSTDDESALTG